MKTLVKVYIDFKDVDNPDWFDAMCKNLYEIYSLKWKLANSWAGWFWRKKEYKNTIVELQIKNKELIRSAYSVKEFPSEKYTFHFDIWRMKNNKYLAMLHIYKEGQS